MKGAATAEKTALFEIAAQFAQAGSVQSVEPLGNGNINSTFLVAIAPSSTQAKRFVLQRINTKVFHQPELVIQNMVALSDHLNASTTKPPRRWETPQILPTQQGENFWVDATGEYWRAISFIEDSHVRETVENAAHAEEVGYGLATFHSLIAQLPAEKLADTLPGFHITPTYLENYEQLLIDLAGSDHWQSISEVLDAYIKSMPPEQAEQTKYGLSFIEKRKDWAHVLEQAKAKGELKLRPIHGDPKVNNIMMGSNGEAVSLIDLDTLKPGLVHYDIGDCLRSGCNLLGEETEDWQLVTFDTSLARAMLRGYLSIAKDFLTPQDYDYLYDGIRLIAFELGLRFFTDYLAGNVYFKVKHPTHNLMRALVQFKLTESIEAQESVLKEMIEELR